MVTIYKLFPLILTIFLKTIYASDVLRQQFQETTTIASKVNGIPASKSLFTPRVDYNQWIPVGLGDPLKKDPTYDYSPPVLDPVRYWGDSSKENKKKDILLLGVSSERKQYNKRNNLDNKHNVQHIKRNFRHELPTVLMPPPIQKIDYSVQKQYSVERPLFYTTPPANNYWSSQIINHMPHDVMNDESRKSFIYVRPNENEVIKSTFDSLRPSHSNSNMKPNAYFQENFNNYEYDDSNYYNIYNSKEKHMKPWVFSLLEKEILSSPNSNQEDSMVGNIYENQQFNNIIEQDEINGKFELTTFFTPTISTVSQMIVTPTTNVLINNTNQYINTENSSIVPKLTSSSSLMHFIIEGHSKVKTYGQQNGSNNNSPKIVPVGNADTDPVVRHVVSTDQHGHTTEVQHLHQKQNDSNMVTRKPTEKLQEDSVMGNLLSLFDSSLSDYFINYNPTNRTTNHYDGESKPIIRDSRNLINEINNLTINNNLNRNTDKT